MAGTAARYNRDLRRGVRSRVHNFVRGVQSKMAVAGHQAFQTQHHDAFSGMEKVLGAHVDGNDDKARRIQQVRKYVQRKPPT